MKEECKHPTKRLFGWTSKAGVLKVACLTCGKMLKGGKGNLEDEKRKEVEVTGSGTPDNALSRPSEVPQVGVERRRCSVCGTELTDNTLWIDDGGLLCASCAKTRRVELMRQTARMMQECKT